MKKETTIAIIFGIILGGIVAVFVIFKNKDLELSKNKVIAPSKAAIETVKTATEKSYQQLEILSPADETILDKNTVSISGKVEPGSLIVIQSPVKDLVLKPETANFNINFPLALGENVIKIVAYPKDVTLRPQEKDMKIYYLDSEL